MSGYLNRGVWRSEERGRTDDEGSFVRDQSMFREWVTPDRTGAYPAEAGRYHLYVSLACPWAHRTLICRALKGLENVIGLSIVDPVSLDEGWVFSDHPGATSDRANGFTALHQLYTLAEPEYSGRVTVPVLWDTVSKHIVSNESADIIRMFNEAFAAYQRNAVDFYPSHLRAEIDAINRFVYENVNDGVYRCGFATSQASYEQAVDRLFAALDSLESRLCNQRYLVGGVLTEADIRLFPTLVRFDAVYFIHFKCGVRRIADYPNLSGYLRDIYQLPGVSETVNLDHIKRHYYLSHRHLNPGGIIPKGPDFDFTGAHDRQRFSE